MRGHNALVAQGGGQRGIFTAGVLDAFLFSNFDPFDSFYGTSAGALNLCPYLCRQPLLSRAFISELTTDSKFFSLFRYIRNKEPLNLSWALEHLLHYPYQLDLNVGKQILGSRKCVAALTREDTLSDEYFPIFSEHWLDVLKASCAIPQLCGDSVFVGKHRYYDGGISASIPVQEAWRNDARLIIVIRTESRSSTSFNDGNWLFGAGYVRRLGYVLGTQFYSELKNILSSHYQTYTQTLHFLEKPPDDCFIIEISPTEPLKSNALMSNRDMLLSDYKYGLELGYRFVHFMQKIYKQDDIPLIYSKPQLR